MLRPASRPQTVSVRAWSFWGSFVLLGALLVHHFVLVQISNMPMTPIKVQLQPAIDRYVNPYFTQNWSFFAPTPLDHSLSLVVRGEFRNARGETRLTNWTDVSGPLFRSVAQNRFTPLGMISLMLSNAVVDFKNKLATNEDAVYRKGGVTYVRSVVPADVDLLDAQVMVRTGTVVLQAAHPTLTFSRVQVGVTDERFPRFTQRNNPDPERQVSFFAVDWQKTPVVEGFCCVKTAGTAPRESP